MNNLLPLFMKLEESNCLVVGGGKIALQKIEQLICSKAKVTVVAPEICRTIKSLPVYSMNRKYITGDIDQAKLVIAATDNYKVNKKIYEDANKRGIPVNVVDQPELCSFYMGSVYQDGDLKVAISTNGKCPSFGTYIKNYIKNISKGFWGTALDDLALKREKIVKTLLSYADKKDVIGKLVKNSLEDSEKFNKSSGKVYLVGAGPGDPELITAKGLRVMQDADIILHDALIHPHLVFEINPLAKKIFVGKREDKHSVSQNAIHSIMVEEAEKGKIVVRLKGGDPFIFGRGGEEILALSKYKINFEVIPGITAGIGAAASFGIPLTHREDAVSTLFITGHQCKTTKTQDWETLAKLNSTLVFYMGTRRLSEIVLCLIENGKSKNTPIAIIENATLNSQQIFTSDLDTILKEVKKIKVLTPAIIIIGDVVRNYTQIQACLDRIPSDMVNVIENSGFDIWKNEAIIA